MVVSALEHPAHGADDHQPELVGPSPLVAERRGRPGDRGLVGPFSRADAGGMAKRSDGLSRLCLRGKHRQVAGDLSCESGDGLHQPATGEGIIIVIVARIPLEQSKESDAEDTDQGREQQ